MGSHGIQDVDGEPRRAFRCRDCERVFVPGVGRDRPSRELKHAVARVRSEADAPYRLIANALGRHLGVSVSHTTVRAWCDEQDPDPSPEDVDDGDLACEYLSVLWALRREIQDEARAESES